MHVIGKLSELILGNNVIAKFEDTRNPSVVVHIRGTTLSNTLIDIGVVINIITRENIKLLGLTNL